MSVGAVGPVGGGTAGAMSAGAGVGASAAGGANSAGGTTPAGLNSKPVTSIADLNLPDSVQLDINSIDLLLALLLLAATRGDDDDKKSSGSAALGFLAGLALAGALGQLDFQFDFTAQQQAGPIPPGLQTGGQLNVTA